MNTKRFSVSAIALIAILAGSLESRAEDAKPVTATEGATTTRDGMKSALKQPLNDLNLLQSENPPTVLREARSAAYARPREVTCDILIAEVRKLDAELDEDLDQQAIEASFKQKATDKALDAMRGAASSFIPYRGAVRFVSGAQKHDRLVAKRGEPETFVAPTSRGWARAWAARTQVRRSGCKPPPRRHHPIPRSERWTTHPL